jgi:hypothetical protein
MIPLPDQSLRNLSQRLMVSLLPEFGSEYAVSDAASLGLLMNALADELAEGIQRRLVDIEEMKVILARCVTLEEERAMLAADITSYTMASVNDRHDELTRLLIAWHEKSEVEDLPEVNKAIWRYLHGHAERHAIAAVP